VQSARGADDEEHVTSTKFSRIFAPISGVNRVDFIVNAGTKKRGSRSSRA
jgi:hypothetical protein